MAALGSLERLARAARLLTNLIQVTRCYPDEVLMKASSDRYVGLHISRSSLGTIQEQKRGAMAPFKRSRQCIRAK
jgi:hypothetical protein